MSMLSKLWWDYTPPCEGLEKCVLVVKFVGWEGTGGAVTLFVGRECFAAVNAGQVVEPSDNVHVPAGDDAGNVSGGSWRWLSGEGG
jgi:hypothetical protein